MYKSVSAQPGAQAPPSDSGDHGKQGNDNVIDAEFVDIDR
jgi:hypothetical protein